MVVEEEEEEEVTVVMEADGKGDTEDHLDMEDHLDTEDHQEEDHREEGPPEAVPPLAQREVTPHFEGFISTPSSRHSKSPNSMDLMRSSKPGLMHATVTGSLARHSHYFGFS
jgi:hypothetical protein